MDPDRPLDIPESIPTQLYPERIAPRLEALYEAYQAGDGSALLESIVLSSSTGCLVPQWCIPRLTLAMNHWQGGVLRNIGEVLNMTRPKGWRSTNQKRARKMLEVWLAVDHAHMEGASLNIAADSSAFLIAAEKFGISDKTAEKYYYEVESRF